MSASIAFVAELDEIAAGERTPERAWATLRAWIDTSPPDLGRRMYVVLKAVTLGQLTGRRQTELTAWVDIMRNAAALLLSREQPALAERMSALADLTSDWCRKLDASAPQRLLRRPHVIRLLHALELRQGAVPREDLRRDVGIGTANLSRILGAMEAAGLIRREPCSRTTTVELTAEGRLELGRASRVETPRTKAAPKPKVSPPARTIADMVAAAKSGRGLKGRAAGHLPLDGMRVATVHNGELEVVGRVIFENSVDEHVLKSSQGFTVLAELNRECVVLNSDVPRPGLIDMVEGKRVFREVPGAEPETVQPLRIRSRTRAGASLRS